MRAAVQALIKARKATTILQAAVRGFMYAQRLGLQRRGATTMAAAWRRFSAAKALRTQRAAALRVQALARGTRARVFVAKTRRAGAVLVRVMCAFVRRVAQKRVQERASRVVQALVRGALARAEWVRLRAAVAVVAAAVRAHRARQVAAAQAVAVVCMQSFARMILQRRALLTAQHAVVALAAAWRMASARAAFLSTWRGAVQAQRLQRGRMAREAFVDTRVAVLACQRIWRTTHAGKLAATRLACWWRGVAARRELASLRQRAAEIRREREKQRRLRAAGTLQRTVRLARLKHRLHVVAGAVRRVQSFLRGCAIRRRNGQKMRRIRTRLAEANRSYSAALSIGARSSAALATLLTNKSLAAVMHACTTLEMVTRYSRSCSRHFIEHDAMRIIFALMASSNRSEPHQHLVVLCLGIVRNLRAWGHVITGGAQRLLGEPELLTLVDLLQNYREKPAISVCALMLFVQEVPTLRASFRANAPVMKRLQSILKLTVRKVSVLKASNSSNSNSNSSNSNSNSSNSNSNSSNASGPLAHKKTSHGTAADANVTMHSLMVKLQGILGLE
jgi:hypothetical protein